MDNSESPAIGEAEDNSTYLFRHKAVRRFSVSGFQFKNFELRIRGAAERARFLAAVKNLEPRRRGQIVEINEAAAAAAETPLSESVSSGGIVRGLMTASDIKTAKDGQLVSGQASAGANALAPNPGAPKPAVNLAGLTPGSTK